METAVASFCLLISRPLLQLESESAGCPKKIVPRLCGYCGGAVDSSISLFTHLYWSTFNLEFETFFESI